MKRIFLVVALFLSASEAFAGTTQKWTAGWSLFNEPLAYKKSNLSWSVNPTTSKLSVTFRLVGSTPSKLYQVGLNFFCVTYPPTFGNFPVHGVDNSDGVCYPLTFQGVIKTVAATELGVVVTDIHGNGTFTVTIGPIAAGTYQLEFYARDGAGCWLIGGAGGACNIDFQSPGPTYGDATTITIP